MENKNAVIAKFMGYEVKEHHKTPGFWLYLKETGVENGKEYTYWADINSDLSYNTSWDKLMPVVEKIESIGFDVWFQTRQSTSLAVTIWSNHGETILPTRKPGMTKIEVVYAAVIEFIEWYNAQPHA